ncbi:hypothetical protein AB6A40_006519 [Gnathostoma spinigerum]|uniref:Uncharacterized protein n=1 Tax=Gnathostoma spinigerum TaxID=75299 RepID=A0ABD6EJS5_9BILA
MCFVLGGFFVEVHLSRGEQWSYVCLESSQNVSHFGLKFPMLANKISMDRIITNFAHQLKLVSKVISSFICMKYEMKTKDMIGNEIMVSRMLVVAFRSESLRYLFRFGRFKRLSQRNFYAMNVVYSVGGFLESSEYDEASRSYLHLSLD